MVIRSKLLPKKETALQFNQHYLHSPLCIVMEPDKISHLYQTAKFVPDMDWNDEEFVVEAYPWHKNYHRLDYTPINVSPCSEYDQEVIATIHKLLPQ